MISSANATTSWKNMTACDMREEFWVLDSRRISFSQVLLHRGHGPA